MTKRLHPWPVVGVLTVCLLAVSAALQSFDPAHTRHVEAAPVAPPSTRPAEKRTVYLVGKLAETELIAFTAAVAAIDPAAVVLLDTPALAGQLKGFLDACKPSEVVLVGEQKDSAALDKQLGLTSTKSIIGKQLPDHFWNTLFPTADTVIVCPSRPHDSLLQAAFLAGILQAPLLVTEGGEASATAVKRRINGWKVKNMLVVGKARELKIEGVTTTELSGKKEIEAALSSRLGKKQPVASLVVCNPYDNERNSGLSHLGPWLALHKRGALLLTNSKGTDATQVVQTALKQPALAAAENLIVLADPRAVPTERRKNPAQGKDETIEMEPCTPDGSEPFTLATGRLFHPDCGVVLLTIAREQLLRQGMGKRSALIASNPGDSLPLMELFSRHTAKEMSNRGFDTTALFGDEITRGKVRKLLPHQDIFLWEGHYKTLIEEFGFPKWDEPLRPSLVYLQSCLALNEAEALPLFQRGAVAVVGSATRTYSGSGGAFTLAYFDSLFYDEQSLGGALRHAKNFLLAYSLLKEKRLGEKAPLTGANVRSAWAFSLWGDPTLKLPLPQAPDNALPPAGHKLDGKYLTLSRPERTYERQTSGKFTAQTGPNTRLAGLLTEGEGESKQLIPFLFAEVRLTPPHADSTPALRTKIPTNRWVLLWDARLHRGYLIVLPPEKGDLQFEVDWVRGASAVTP